MTTQITLPKDAEGREIPLDVEFLYRSTGERVKPYSFTFKRYDGFGWEMRLVGAPNLVYDPKRFYLTPPDSWEKLKEDLDRCADAHDYEECAYFGKEASSCSSCVAGKEASCSKTAIRDIASRISKLRGED